MVYKITIYDNNWHTVNVDYHRLDDRQAAEIRAESDAAWLGYDRWEVEPIR